MRKEYGDFWDKPRLIDACLELCKDDWCFVAFPKIEEKMFTTEKIQAERINAVLKTHNIDYDKFAKFHFEREDCSLALSDSEKKKIDDCNICCSGIIQLVSYTISQDAVAELNNIIKPYLTINWFDKHCDLNSYSARCMIFHYIFLYRKQLEHVKHFYDGVLECTYNEAVAINFVYGTFDKEFKKGIETLERALALLLGDNFATPIPVSELKAKYGYPEMSDSELDELIDDMW